MKRAKVLVVDDEEGVRTALSQVLKDEGLDVHTVASGEDCLAECNRKNYDIILLDVWLPGMDGLEVLQRLNPADHSPGVIMISGHGTIETAVKATKLGAYDFIEKPLTIDKTLLVVNRAIEQKKLEEKHRFLRDKIFPPHEIIGQSRAIEKLREEINMAAPTNGRVIIFGENGTGKELVARNIHSCSLRSNESFIELNCAAIPEDLIESELFGHVKGSFTGATEDKKGKFELADEGTLFLDEIADMSLKTQAKVLRALEEQRFQPVGSTEDIIVEVRVITATNKNLEEAIEKGTFREDLYFRLNVIPIYVPPLRERKEDIALLAEHFLKEFCKEYGKKEKHLHHEVIELFSAYRWPGNVRELKNIIERLVIMVARSEIRVDDLPLALRGGTSGSAFDKMDFSSLKEARSHFEKEFILKKLDENLGNVAKTARALKVERSSFYRKLKNLKIKS